MTALTIEKQITPEHRQIIAQHIRRDDRRFPRPPMTIAQIHAERELQAEYAQALAARQPIPEIIVMELAPGDLVLVGGHPQWLAAHEHIGAVRLPAWVYRIDVADLQHVTNLQDIYPTTSNPEERKN